MLAVCKTWKCARFCLPGLVCAHALFWCVEQLALNWGMQGESDCLIKTKHCDGHAVMMQCDFCPVL